MSDTLMRSYELQRAKHCKMVRSWLHAQFQRCFRESAYPGSGNGIPGYNPTLNTRWIGTLTEAMDQWEFQRDIQEHILRSFQEMVRIIAPLNRRPLATDVPLSRGIEESMMRPINALINLYNDGLHPSEWHPNRVVHPYVLPHPDLRPYDRTWGSEAVAYINEKERRRVLKKLPLDEDMLKHVVKYL